MDAKELKRLSLAELIALSDRVSASIEQKRGQQRVEALDKIKEIAEIAGIDLSELAKARNAKSKVRYRHPNDNSKTWAGRGRKPFWLIEELAAGRNLAEFAI